MFIVFFVKSYNAALLFYVEPGRSEEKLISSVGLLVERGTAIAVCPAVGAIPDELIHEVPVCSVDQGEGAFFLLQKEKGSTQNNEQ